MNEQINLSKLKSVLTNTIEHETAQQEKHNEPVETYVTESDILCHQRVMEYICEYLIDHKIDNEFLHFCLSNQYFTEDNIPVTLQKKRYLFNAMKCFDSISVEKLTIQIINKALKNIIKLCQLDNNEMIISLPSLIGIVGMSLTFQSFVKKQILISDVTNWLELLLPNSNTIPYVMKSRELCQNIINVLAKIEIPDEIDAIKFLSNIPTVQILLSKYPLNETMKFIKIKLEEYRQNLPINDIQRILFPIITPTLKLDEKQNVFHNFEEEKSVIMKEEKEKSLVKKVIKKPTNDKGEVIKMKKRRFTEEETKNLIEGVQKFGIGHWKQILENYSFENRSCVDLKDKWRNIETSKLKAVNRMKSSSNKDD